MTKTPSDVYTGLIRTRLSIETQNQIPEITGRFSGQSYGGDPLSVHLTRFIGLFCRLISYLDSREVAGFSDLTEAIDLLDHLASTSKWWVVTRDDPGFMLRPTSHDPREFMKGLSSIHVGSDTVSRINNAAERLASFLQEQEIGLPRERTSLCEDVVSSWSFLSGMICKGQGNTTTSETDFETAYDVLRVLFFHARRDDYRALTAVRKLGTSPELPKIASVVLSPGFERQLESSPAAGLDNKYSVIQADRIEGIPVAVRGVLTNALRFLVQIQAAKNRMDRVDESSYGSMTKDGLGLLQTIGITPDTFRDERAVGEIFRHLKPANGVSERITHLIRRLETLIVGSTGNRDFLLRYGRLVPRMVALILLVAAATKTDASDELSDLDVKRGLILISKLLNA